MLLIDEVHTPDFVPLLEGGHVCRAFATGQEPENFDKEFLRLSYAEQGYRGDGPIPEVRPVGSCQPALHHIYEMLTGQAFLPGRYPVEPRLVENLTKAGIIR